MAHLNRIMKIPLAFIAFFAALFIATSLDAEQLSNEKINYFQEGNVTLQNYFVNQGFGVGGDLGTSSLEKYFLHYTLVNLGEVAVEPGELQLEISYKKDNTKLGDPIVIPIETTLYAYSTNELQEEITPPIDYNKLEVKLIWQQSTEKGKVVAQWAKTFARYKYLIVAIVAICLVISVKFAL